MYLYILNIYYYIYYFLDRLDKVRDFRIAYLIYLMKVRDLKIAYLTRERTFVHMIRISY